MLFRWVAGSVGLDAVEYVSKRVDHGGEEGNLVIEFF